MIIKSMENYFERYVITWKEFNGTYLEPLG